MRTALLGWMIAASFGLTALVAREARADDCGSVKGMLAFDGTPCLTQVDSGCDLGIIDADAGIDGVCIGGCCIKDTMMSGSSSNGGMSGADGGVTSSGAGAGGAGAAGSGDSTGAKSDQFAGGACGVTRGGNSGAMGVLALTALLVVLTWWRGRCTCSMGVHRERALRARRRSRCSHRPSPRSPNTPHRR